MASVDVHPVDVDAWGHQRAHAPVTETEHLFDNCLLGWPDLPDVSRLRDQRANLLFGDVGFVDWLQAHHPQHEARGRRQEVDERSGQAGHQREGPRHGSSNPFGVAEGQRLGDEFANDE